MNFPYWPLLEYLIRSSHIGWATSSISSSLWSTMFTRLFLRCFLFFTHQVIKRSLLHGVFAGFGITAGNGQHMPVLVVQLHCITAVVVTRPAGFLAEQRVLQDR